MGEYLQAFVAVMESGAVYLVRVKAHTPDSGAYEAGRLAETLDGGPLWHRGHVAPYPCGEAITAEGAGFEVLKEKENKESKS